MGFIVCIWHWVLWMVLGFMVVLATLTTHVIRAELKGYKALEWLERRNHKVFNSFRSTGSLLGAVVLGFTIWPIRLAQFVSSIPDLYEKYETKF